MPNAVSLRVVRLLRVSFSSAVLCTISVSLAHAQKVDLSSVLLADGLDKPVFMTAAPTGGAADARLFIVEQTGKIRILENGQLSTFLDIPQANFGAAGGERGLLGLAFDPNYNKAGTAGYGRFYVDYVDKTSGQTVIASYNVSANRNVANTVETRILAIDQPFENHKGGWIGFRPGESSNLYIATGDGGAANDPNHNAQNTNVLLGKILRVDVHTAAAGKNYSIPMGNPFGNEVYAYGLRNPYRDSFDRKTGDLYIADVGQNVREEIDVEANGATPGSNFGWRLREGTIATPTPQSNPVGGPKPPGAIDPVFDYRHPTDPNRDPSFYGIAVTGGYVYRGDAIPQLDGTYLFADYATSRVWSMRIDPLTGKITELDAHDDDTGLASFEGISSFGEDALGNLYVVSYGDVNNPTGKLYALVPEPTTWALMAVALVGVGFAGRRRTLFALRGQHRNA